MDKDDEVTTDDKAEQIAKLSEELPALFNYFQARKLHPADALNVCLSAMATIFSMVMQDMDEKERGEFIAAACIDFRKSVETAGKIAADGGLRESMKLENGMLTPVGKLPVTGNGKTKPTLH